MTTRRNKGLLVICGFSMICLFAHFFSTTLQGSPKRYEVKPEITLPEYKTDITRVIEAYEHIVDNYLKVTESNLADIRVEMGDITKKIDSINQKISELSTKLDTIQKKLGIEPQEKPSQKSSGSEKDIISENSNDSST